MDTTTKLNRYYTCDGKTKEFYVEHSFQVPLSDLDVKVYESALEGQYIRDVKIKNNPYTISESDNSTLKIIFRSLVLKDFRFCVSIKRK